MKLSPPRFFLIVSLFLGSALAASASHASKAPRHGRTVMGATLVSTVAALDAGELDDVAPTITLPDVFIMGRRGANAGHVRAQSTTWVCGPVEANAIGGSQRTCEYR
jgi:hypothetical protein